MKKYLILFIIASLLSLGSCSSQNPPQDGISYQTDASTESSGGVTVIPESDSEAASTAPGTSSEVPTPDTKLEFQITENVDNVDFSKYQRKQGLFGGKAYYGTGYIPTTDGKGQQTDPNHCVVYTVTSYPDYSDKEQHITNIKITDPAVEVYGVTLQSSFEDFKTAMENQGYEITRFDEICCIAEKDNISISFTSKDINIRADVENKNGIIF